MGKEERKKRFMQMLGEGDSIGRTCAALGISRQMYYKWRRQDPDFAQQCDLIIGSNAEARGRKAEREDADGSNAETPEGFIPFTGSPLRLSAAQEEKRLRAALRERGTYGEWLEPQIRAAARLWASALVMERELDLYAGLQTEISREGNPRLTVNKAPAEYTSLMTAYQSALKSLGLTADSKTEPREQSSRDRFLKMLDDD